MNPRTAGATALDPVDHDAVIVTEQLTKVYPGNIRAVDGLDLAVRRGEIFGLLGPNGAGKTTDRGDADDARHPDERAARSSAVSTWLRTRRPPST